jgi:hypothetical protein
MGPKRIASDSQGEKAKKVRRPVSVAQKLEIIV